MLLIRTGLMETSKCYSYAIQHTRYTVYTCTCTYKNNIKIFSLNLLLFYKTIEIFYRQIILLFNILNQMFLRKLVTQFLRYLSEILHTSFYF